MLERIAEEHTFLTSIFSFIADLHSWLIELRIEIINIKLEAPSKKFIKLENNNIMIFMIDLDFRATLN